LWFSITDRILYWPNLLLAEPSHPVRKISFHEGLAMSILSSLLDRLRVERPSAQPAVTDRLKVKVAAVVPLSPRVRQFRLVSATGQSLPGFTPGAHIDVHLAESIARQYSLCGDPSADAYEIAVLHVPGGAGSSQIHRDLTVGARIEIGRPRNQFPLNAATGRAHLIAGGIGITPFMALLPVLDRQQADFTLHYCCRTPEEAPFLGLLTGCLDPAQLQLYFSRTDPPRRFDPAVALADFGDGDLVYACGPAGLLDAIRQEMQRRGIAADRLRTESFTPPAPKGGSIFEIELASTGEVFTVGADESLLAALTRLDLDPPSSCGQGICGSCRTKVLSGTVLHADHILSTAERRCFMTPCVSRGVNRIVLDL
jgi:vanillate monooxygenase ferredoxin subunit